MSSPEMGVLVINRINYINGKKAEKKFEKAKDKVEDAIDDIKKDIKKSSR